jgi:GntR family transcriptional regulator
MQERRKGEPVLIFSLDATDGVPFYKQIIHQVELAITDGRLRTGDQLPTVRGLAVELKITPNTVARAYSELEIRGIVNTQQGSGTFISDKKIQLSDVDRERMLAGLTGSFIRHAASYGYTLGEIIQYLKDLEGGTVE